MILMPLALGQGLSYAGNGQFAWTAFAHAVVFGVLFQIYLLYTNDHADAAIDRTSTQYWLSSGSRVLPDGKLQRHQLLVGARLVLLSLTGFVLYLGVSQERPLVALGLLAAVALSWAYDRDPLHLSYRGHGEVLQGLGCGVLLPLVGYYLQAGSLADFHWLAVIPLFFVFYASNIVTALPDYESDKQGNKRTLPVRYGQPFARWVVVLTSGFVFLGYLFLLDSPSFSVRSAVSLPAMFVLMIIVFSGLIRHADVSNFARCKWFVSLASASQVWFLGAWLTVLATGTE